MRRAVIAVAALLILAVANFVIYQKENLLTSGRQILLELAPVDPRSLMQGDYMALRFRIANDAWFMRDNLPDGRVVLAVDDRGVARLVRVDDGGPIGAGEVVMRYRMREGRPKFATNAFFFQEGNATKYSTARYGEFRVDRNGDSILTGMRGPNLEPLGK